MTHAYNELYREQATNTFASMMDYATNDCGINGDTFLQMLRISGVAVFLEQGSPAYVAGKSGVEIVREVLRKSNPDCTLPPPENRFNKTAEYWAGWVLAQFQWFSGLRFHQITSALNFEKILDLYPTLHEADITKFFSTAAKAIKKAQTETNLKRLRKRMGFSQSELAKASGVSLRSIQMYEQWQKDINKAQVMTVADLSKVLSCDINDLLEYTI